MKNITYGVSRRDRIFQLMFFKGSHTMLTIGGMRQVACARDAPKFNFSYVQNNVVLGCRAQKSSLSP